MWHKLLCLLTVTAMALCTCHCGGGQSIFSTSRGIPDTNTPGGNSVANTFNDIQSGPGWNGYALLPPSYHICESCSPAGPEATWSTEQGVTSPSLSGGAMRFNLGGSKPFADTLWNVKFTKRLPDEKMVPRLHNFTYDLSFFGADLETSQALEFDINQFFAGKSFIWGHECRIAGGHEWDTWDNVNKHWVKSGIACNPANNAWNHLTIRVQRTSDDRLLFQSITLNGVTHTLNRYDNPSSTTWYGLTVNYQMDGNRNQQPYTVYLDKFNFTYF